MRRIVACGALIAVGALAACTRVYPGGDGSTLCGHHLDTGPMNVIFQPLDPHQPAPPGPPPTVSSLPPPVTGLATAESYIRTSPTCAAGAVVVVTPADAAHSWVTIPADDGRITGIALAQVTAPLTVSAWVGGRYQGTITVRPAGASPVP